MAYQQQSIAQRGRELMSEPSISQVTRAISRRMPWTVATSVFSWLDIPRGKGWDNTIEKYEGARGKQEEADRLQTAYREHLVAGEKSIRIYGHSEKTCRAVRTWLLKEREKIKDPNKELFREEDEIQSLSTKKPKLIAVESFESGVAGIYESVRTTEVREQIDPKKVRQANGAPVPDFKELIGIRLEKKQQFDVIWVPHGGGRIEVRVDNPIGTTIETQSTAHFALTLTFAESFGEDLFKKPVNLFPLIKAMYEDQTEGLVAELGFITTTGSIKVEKMRRAHTCLRRELYHKAGKAALSVGIEPFKLSVRWESIYEDKVRGHLELQLKGNTRLLHTTNPVLYDAEIRGCGGVADYDIVRTRIEHHLNRLTP